MTSSHFYAMLSRMKYINRWGLMNNTRLENISEHSQQVAILTHCLVLIHNKRFGGELDAQRETDAVIPDEAAADAESVRDAALYLLLLVGDIHAEILAVAEQVHKGLHLARRRDDQDVTDPTVDQQRQGIIDHRLVINGDQRFADRNGRGVKTGASSCGKNDSLHFVSLISLILDMPVGFLVHAYVPSCTV